MSAERDDEIVQRVETAFEGMKKDEWGEGPWLREPDNAEWVFHGFRCYAHRHRDLGNWCGYIEIPPGHLWHRCDANDVPSATDGVGADVHGGFTFADTWSFLGDGWYLGFDCGHSCDYQPALEARTGGFRKSSNYRTLEYVRQQLEGIAREAEALAKLRGP